MSPLAPVSSSPRSAPRAPDDWVRAVPALATLSPRLAARVGALATVVRVAAGEWLFRRDQLADRLHMVRSGHLEEVQEAGRPVRLRTVTRGAVLGEAALLVDEPRTTSVRALRDSELLEISRDHFEALLNTEPRLARELAHMLGTALGDRAASPAFRRAGAVVIAVTAVDPSAPVLALAMELARGLSAHGSAALVLPAQHGDAPTSDHASLAEDLERGHHRVVLACGAADVPNAWTDFCLAHADRVVAVTAGGRILRPLRGGGALHGCDLVGYHGRPRESLTPWIEALQPASIHLVRGDRHLAGDVARLARRLAGRSPGVVLSGGGARALSQLAVLEGIVSTGVPVDRVAGAGMGAFIAALLASGRDPGEMDACCREEWVRRRPLGDSSSSRRTRSGRVLAVPERVFGDLDIEDLPRSFYCASTDLRASSLVIDRSGPLADAVAASLSLPPMAAPRRRGERLLVDGSLLDPLPLAPMVAASEGPVIAVNVLGGEPAPDGPGATGARSRREERRRASLPDALTRIALLNAAATAQSARRRADAVIDVRVPGIGLLDFDRIDQARERGGRAVDALLADPPAWLTAPSPNGARAAPTVVRL